MVFCVSPLIALFATLAVAQQPLAIPVGETHSPPPVEPGGPPPARPTEQARAVDKTGELRAYRDQHLGIHTWSQLAALYPTSSLGYGYGFGYPGGLWGSVAVAPPTIIREERWGVYQGPRRLDNLEYLLFVGAGQDRQRVLQQITAKRRLSTGLNGVALAGAGAAVVGMIGMRNARTEPTYLQYQVVSSSGVLALFSGAIGGAFPSSKVRRLQYEPTEIRSLGEFQQEIADHNARLARELGLTPAEALQVENQPSQ